MSTCGCGGDSNGHHLIVQSPGIQSLGGGRAGYPHIDVGHVRLVRSQPLEHRERGRALRHDVLEATEPHLLRRGIGPARHGAR